MELTLYFPFYQLIYFWAQMIWDDSRIGITKLRLKFNFSKDPMKQSRGLRQSHSVTVVENFITTLIVIPPHVTWIHYVVASASFGFVAGSVRLCIWCAGPHVCRFVPVSVPVPRQSVPAAAVTSGEKEVYVMRRVAYFTRFRCKVNPPVVALSLSTNTPKRSSFFAHRPPRHRETQLLPLSLFGVLRHATPENRTRNVRYWFDIIKSILMISRIECILIS